MRRALTAVAGLVLGLAALVGVEVLLALRRDYLPTKPVLEIEGSFGPRDGRSLRFVVLGDSTAAGIGAGDVERSYPVLLARRLAERLDRRVELVSLGVSGARVGDLVSEQVDEAKAQQPDLVFVGIGANDVTHVTPLGDVRKEMGAALDALQATDAAVAVAGAPDMRARAFLEPLRTLTGWRGRQVTAAIADVARSRVVPVVPLAEKTQGFFGEDPERYYSADDFHPGPHGYELWANAIEPVLLRALRAEPGGR